MLGRRFITFVLFLLALNWLSVALFAPSGTTSIRIPYSPTFLDQVTAGNVSSIASQGTLIDGVFRKSVTYPSGSGGTSSTHFNTDVPEFADKVALARLLQSKGVTVNASPPSSGRSLIGTLLLSFGPTLLFIGLLVLLLRRAGGGGTGPLGAFGRSRARRADPSAQRVSFADVAGIEEAKAELAEIVDFLSNPQRYVRLGGRIPRGVLLSGAPGTGKTLLARAVAGEAHVPFFSISASEFVEAIVGVGASRVRDLFKQAKEASPAIIFIDELDAIGRQRGSALVTGANDEREQTLNQILTEMDGFESDLAVIVLAATNRPEVLDPALLRPGRFDRRITVPAPDKDGRRKILEVHTRSLPLADDVDLDRVAAVTPGMVGADLANLANEAALMAARREHTAVEMPDFTDALEKIVLGAPRSLVLSPADRRRTAYHEAGHAIVGMLTPGADPVRKVSIIPRGMALGVTLSAPDADRVSYDEEYLLAQIKVALGGRAAEEEVLNRITTGAESDIQQVTQIARMMVGRWGMSDVIGPVAVLPRETIGPLLPGVSEASETTHRLVDEEVRRIVEEADAEVRDLLRGRRDQLDALASALLEAETLDQDAAYAAAGIAMASAEPQSDGAVTATGAPAQA
jgi:cell division protease FtsH